MFWSRRQNDTIPIDSWLVDLAKRTADTGLEIVAISEEDLPANLTEYLAKHPFPGSVAIDLVDVKKGGSGEWFDAFFLGSKFMLPRLLLLDIDQRVVWEGSPGFDAGSPWKPGLGSFLDTPLDELVAKRGLKVLAPWRRAWAETGAEAAIRAGDLSKAGKLLGESRALPGDLVPEVAKAQAFLHVLDGALAAFDRSADALMTQTADPAVATLAAWGALVGRPIDPAKVKNLKKAGSSAASAAWTSALVLAAHAQKDLAALAVKLAGMNGRLPKLLGERIQTAVDAGDLEAARKVLSVAPLLPGAFLSGWLTDSGK